MSDVLKFVVIGMPGHGKSTFLNEFAGEPLFETASGKDSCTQAEGEWVARNVQLIRVSDGKTEHVCQLIDTPGFPDPDLTKAAPYYDHVVQQCKQELHGVIFVMNPGRLVAGVLDTYRVLLREFVNLGPPLVLIVNGTEPGQKKFESDAAFDARIKKVRPGMCDCGDKVRKEAGLQPKHIFVSTNMGELAALCPQILSTLATAPAAPSPGLRTFEQVRVELELCKDDHYARASQVERAETRKARCENNISELRDEVRKLEISAAATGWFPFFGAITAGTLLAVAANRKARIPQLEREIGEAIAERAAAGDVQKVRREMNVLQDRFNALASHLRR